VKRWGVATLVLDEDEKLLGRRLVQLGTGGTVSAVQLSADIGIAADQLDRALNTLQHLQLISWQSRDGWLSFLLKPDYSERFHLAGYNRIQQEEAFKNYQAWIRFSNGNPDPNKPDIEGNERGMSMKVLDVPGGLSGKSRRMAENGTKTLFTSQPS